MKNKRAIYLLFLSNIISGFAQGISMIAIPLYFVEVVGRPHVFSISYIIITNNCKCIRMCMYSLF